MKRRCPKPDFRNQNLSKHSDTVTICNFSPAKYQLQEMPKFWTLFYELDIHGICSSLLNDDSIFYLIDFKTAWTERVRNTTLAWCVQSTNACNEQLFEHSGFC
jgi:hypothetical protein